MSVHTHRLCSHLQNCTRANVALTSVPHTKLNLALCLGLYSQGLLSGVQRGSLDGPDQTYIETTNENIASRRLWIKLKYRNNEPVLSKLNVVSSPAKKVWMDSAEIERLCTGRRVVDVKPLAVGEVMFLSTDKGIMEAREALRQRIGGQLLCRGR